MSSLRELRAKALRFVEGQPPGRVATALPHLWFFHARRPQAAKRVEARMVTLAVIMQGKKTVEMGGRAFTYEPGQYLFVLGENRYVSRIPEASDEVPYVSMAVELEPEAIARTLLELADAGARFDDPGAEAPAVVGRLERPILDALARLEATLHDPVARAVLAPSVEKELLVHLLRSPSGATLRRAAAADDGRIRRAVTYLREHATERITIEAVARHVAMSPSHFAHRFRDVVRMSPMQFVKHLRLQQARLLMVGEGLGAAEAGSSVGYASPSHFTRDFKSVYGAPPAAYAQQFRATP